MKAGFPYAVFAAIFFSICVWAEDPPSISVKGLFKNAVVIVVNGRQHYLKAGDTTPEGVTLVSASSKGAVIEIDGKRESVNLSRQIGASYSAPTEKIVRLSRQHNGHFFGSVRINGHSTQVLVDTGASSVVLNSRVASQIGIKYQKGIVTRVATAQGVTRGFQVNLRSVAMGDITVKNVAAIVLEGEYPLDVLLGNTFLSKVDMRVEGGVMILQSKY